AARRPARPGRLARHRDDRPHRRRLRRDGDHDRACRLAPVARRRRRVRPVVLVAGERPPQPRDHLTARARPSQAWDPSAVPRLQAKSFETPDESRALPNSSTASIVNLGEVVVGYGVWSPGWRWSMDLRPIVGTDWCENHHVGYALSGTLEVLTDTGD